MIYSIAIAPVLIVLAYVYYRDRYEKEPIGLLMKGLVFGVLIVFPILLIESWVSVLGEYLDGWGKAAFDAFCVSAFVEETIKFMALFLLIWRNPNFNEKFDGIVYAVFVSLGFAMIENLIYLSSYGGTVHVGLARAFTAVPAHACFGIMMGFELGRARFENNYRQSHLRKALFFPFLFHGVYDFILLSGNRFLLIFFFPFLLFMIVKAHREMNRLAEESPFK